MAYVKEQVLLGLLVAIVAGVSPAQGAEPIGTAFTYQGQLKHGGVPINCTRESGCGGCSFEFRLYDAESEGGQVCPGGEPVCEPVTRTEDVVNGLFKADLDFGPDAFNDDARWLQVDVCCPPTDCTIRDNSTPLDPRQPIRPAPYSVRALITDTLCVDTIQDLRAVNPDLSSCVRVLGYWEVGDGGRGEFYWDADFAKDDNGGTILAPLSDPSAGRWRRVLEGPGSVKWFGAKGDAVTCDSTTCPEDPCCDDTCAIQSAINSVRRDGTLLIPPGNYCISGNPAITVDAPITILAYGAVFDYGNGVNTALKLGGNSSAICNGLLG